jgi:hypothetical protein
MFAPEHELRARFSRLAMAWPERARLPTHSPRALAAEVFQKQRTPPPEQQRR